MVYRFLAIDPSTTSMGLVVFEGGQPVDVETVVMGGGDALARINGMVDAIRLLIGIDTGIQAVACETWGGPRNPGGIAYPLPLFAIAGQPARDCSRPLSAAPSAT